MKEFLPYTAIELFTKINKENIGKVMKKIIYQDKLQFGATM